MSSGVGTETGEPKGLLYSRRQETEKEALLCWCTVGTFSLSLKLRGIHFSLDSLHAHPDRFLVVFEGGWCCDHLDAKHLWAGQAVRKQ